VSSSYAKGLERSRLPDFDPQTKLLGRWSFRRIFPRVSTILLWRSSLDKRMRSVAMKSSMWGIATNDWTRDTPVI
jgi:hypothetical protein